VDLDAVLRESDSELAAAAGRLRGEGASEEAVRAFAYALLERASQEVNAAPVQPVPSQRELEARRLRKEAERAARLRRVSAEKQREHDARCIEYQHHRREIDHCVNPKCPSLHPELWEGLSALEEIRERLGDE
jgi:hypothetical protein